MVSTQLKHISQNGSFPQVGVTINMFQNTTSRNHKTPINTNQESFGGDMINGDLFNKKLLPLVAFKQVQSTVRIQIQGLWIFFASNISNEHIYFQK